MLEGELKMNKKKICGKCKICTTSTKLFYPVTFVLLCKDFFHNREKKSDIFLYSSRLINQSMQY